MSMLLAVQTWHYQLSMTRSLLLLAICDSAEDDGTGCTASEDYLAWKTGLSHATIYRELNALEATQIITRLRLADGRREITVFLHNAKRKPDWNRRRRGRPAQEPKEHTTQESDNCVSHRGDYSHSETQLSNDVNTSQPENNGSHTENNGSHTENNGSHCDASLLLMIHPMDPSLDPSSHPAYRVRERKNLPPALEKLSSQTERREQWRQVKTILLADGTLHGARTVWFDTCALYEPQLHSFILTTATTQQRDMVRGYAETIRLELQRITKTACTLAVEQAAKQKQRSASA